jgi:hypothetical protein
VGFDMYMLQEPTALPDGHVPQYDGQPDYFRFNVAGMRFMRRVMERAGAIDDTGDGPLPDWPPPGLDEDRAMALEERADALAEQEEPEPPMTDGERRIMQAWLDATAEGEVGFPPEGIDEDRAEALLAYVEALALAADIPPPTDDEQAKLDGYEAALDVALAATTPDGRTPGWKFGSNEGWHVTPAECTAIADRLGAALADHPAALWKGQKVAAADARELITAWIAYNRLAAGCGGYRVT